MEIRRGSSAPHRAVLAFAGRRTRLAAGLGTIVVCLAVAAAGAQLPGRDPLTRSEANAMRNAAGNPGKRVQLLLEDAGQRLERLKSLQKSNLPDRLTSMHLMLRQYREILGELDDNFDEWMSGHTTSEMGGKPKVKKPLTRAIAAEQGFLKTLGQVKADSSPSDLETYRFALSDAEDATRGDIQDQQSDLAEIQRRQAESKAAKKKHHKFFPFAALRLGRAPRDTAARGPGGWAVGPSNGHLLTLGAFPSCREAIAARPDHA